MDFRLKAGSKGGTGHGHPCFNPCSNGLSAQSHQGRGRKAARTDVSILVLMDFRLKGWHQLDNNATRFSFNPCSNGLSAQSALEQRGNTLEGGFQSLF